MENRYPCPQCGAILKPAKPVPAGKKLRCPKCETIFAPAAADVDADVKPAAAAKAAKKPRLDDDEEGVGTYGMNDPEEAETAKEERKKAMGPLKDRRPKSTRGAAQAIATKPSNQMLATATMFCVSCVISIVVILFPIVFPPVEKKDEDGLPDPQAKVKVLTPEQKKARAVQGAVVIAFAVLAFVYNGFIAVGAVKMQSLESYGMAMAASVLIALPFEWALAYPAFFWFLRLVIGIAGDDYYWHFLGLTLLTIAGWVVYVGLWNVATLRKPEIISGFQEERPTDS